MAGFQPCSRSLWRRLRRDFALAATAIILAVIAWFLITDSENETVVEQLGFALTVEAVNVPGGLATASRIPPALIEIAGREDDVAAASQDDFLAVVDLGGLPAGTHEIPVSVDSRNDDVTVRSVQPLFVQVTLESLVTRLVQVSVEVENAPPLGFEIGDPVADIGTVSVSGVQQLVDLIDTVVASVNIGGATVDVDTRVSLQARTSTGAAVTAVQISPPAINVQVPVRQEIFRRAVAVTPLVLGEPAPGFRLAAVSVQPTTVVVVGTLEALEGAASATTLPVQIGGRHANLEVLVSVLPPDGVALENPSATVLIGVSLATFTEEAVFRVPVEVTGLGGGLDVELTPARVEIRVRGPAPVIDALDPASFRVTINAIGAPPGISAEPVQVSFGADVDIVSVTPEDVTIEIIPPPPEPAEDPPAGGTGVDGA